MQSSYPIDKCHFCGYQLKRLAVSDYKTEYLDCFLDDCYDRFQYRVYISRGELERIEFTIPTPITDKTYWITIDIPSQETRIIIPENIKLPVYANNECKIIKKIMLFDAKDVPAFIEKINSYLLLI